MMSYFNAFLAGFIQGLTEFLPLSSSGHVVLMQKLFQINYDPATYLVVVQLGTLFAMLLYYKNEYKSIFKSMFRSRTSILVNPTVRLICLVVSASLPSLFMGLYLREYLDVFFGSTRWLGIFFIITGLILFISRSRSVGFESMRTNTEYISHQITFVQAFLIGIAQALTVFPGLSRSGITIAAGQFLGIKKQNAAFFSFLISVPAILVALFWDLEKILFIENIPTLIALFISSLFFGFLGLNSVLYLLNRGKLHYFAIYLIPLGTYLLFAI